MTRSFDATYVHLDAERVRLHIESWTHTKLGDEVDPVTRVRVHEALDRLVAAARAAGKEAA